MASNKHQITLEVTTDQEEAIKALFVHRGWAYRNLSKCIHWIFELEISILIPDSTQLM